MSKARDIADLVSAGGILADGAIATTEITGVTATSAELNYNDITTLGTAQASKVLTTDSNTSVKFGDGVFASNNNAVIMGASDDLRVYHDSGTGRSTLHSAPNFDIFSDNAVYIKKGDPSSSDILIATGGAASSVLLYYSGSQKLATTSTGIDVTGTADMDTLSIGGTAVTSTAAELNYNDITTLGTSEASKAVTADSNGNVKLTEELQTTCYLETVVALSGTTPTVDCDEANSFTLSTTGNTTFTFDYSGVNLTTNDAYGFILKITAGGTHTLTWPSSVDWAGGTAPDAPASGETDVYVFYTVDGGTNWYGALAIDAAG